MTFQLRSLVTGFLCALTLVMQGDEKTAPNSPAVVMTKEQAHAERSEAEKLFLKEFMKMAHLHPEPGIRKELKYITDKIRTNTWAFRVRMVNDRTPDWPIYATAWIDGAGQPTIGFYPLNVEGEAERRRQEFNVLGGLHKPDLVERIDALRQNSVGETYIALLIREGYRLDAEQVSADEFAAVNDTQASMAWEYMVTEGLNPSVASGRLKVHIIPSLYAAWMAHRLDEVYPEKNYWKRFIHSEQSHAEDPRLWEELLEDNFDLQDPI